MLFFQALLTLGAFLVVFMRARERSAEDDEANDDELEKKDSHVIVRARQLCGLALFLPSFAIWFWSRWLLGEHNSFAIAALAPPKLVKDGPFAYTCHPVYISSFVYMFAFALIMGSKVAILLLTFVALPVQLWRATNEGKVLKKTFGFRYTRYLEDVININWRKRRLWWVLLWLVLLAWFPTVALGSPDPKDQKWRRNAEIAQETYKRLTPCLSFDRKYDFSYPPDAVEHHAFLLNVTAKYRGFSPHTGQGYFREKWIENYFIEAFVDQPLETFSGLFPLFVQWSDIDYIEHNRDPSQSTRARADLFAELLRHLRSDVMYVTVSQANKGLEPVKLLHPNVLVMNSGGEGNIPIPLIKGKLGRQSTPSFLKFDADIGFMGNIAHDYTRVKAMTTLKTAIRLYNERIPPTNKATGTRIQQPLRLSMREASDNNTLWQAVMGGTLFNLAPRGFGRASFRLAEIVQLGRVPVYIYNDVPWLPYAGTPAGCDNLGFVVRDTETELTQFVSSVGGLLRGKEANDEVRRLLEQVQTYRYEYTYKGVVRQMQLFFKDPLDSSGLGMDGGGFLRCAHVPHDELAASLDNLMP
jgi:protein-S-isoprenylcysteine O-methyltransferase Ste14